MTAPHEKPGSAQQPSPVADDVALIRAITKAVMDEDNDRSIYHQDSVRAGVRAALARAGQDYDAIRAEAFREAAAVAKSRAAELRTIWGRQAAHLHENDAEMVARELDRQAKAILALAAAPQKGEG